MPSHQEVAAAWARQTGKHRKGFNVFYEGDTIYSYGYHFPLARRSPEHGIVWLNRSTYSKSTSKHQTIVWRACYDLLGSSWTTIETAHPDRAPGNPMMVLEEILADVQEKLAKAKRARVWTDSYLDQADHRLRQAAVVARAYDLPPIASVADVEQEIFLRRARRAFAKAA